MVLSLYLLTLDCLCSHWNIACVLCDHQQVHLEQIPRRLRKLHLSGLNYDMRPGATVVQIEETEQRLKLQFCGRVASLWSLMDGLEVQDPPFQLLPLSDLTLENGLVVFATCNGIERLALDTRSINVAGEWDIVNPDTGYRLTLTIGSFWSMHLCASTGPGS